MSVFFTLTHLILYAFYCNKLIILVFYILEQTLQSQSELLINDSEANYFKYNNEKDSPMTLIRRSATVLFTLSALTLAAPSAFAGYNVIDFDTASSGSHIANGEIVTDQYLADYGVTISGCNWNGTATHHQMINNKCKTNLDDVYNRQVAFDTNLSHTRDPDLEFFNAHNDYQSEYTALNIGDYHGDNKPNNILIIQENSKGCNDGVCDYPDDEASRPAGFFEFNFDQLVDIVSIDFFDIEEKSNNIRNRISFYEGNTEKSFGNVPHTGDGSYERVAFNASGIDRLVIRMPGSGGIDNLVFRTGHADVPAPASFAVLLLGLVALSFRKIRG